MTRFALLMLLAIAATSYYFAHLPVQTPPPREKGVVLEGVTLRLYPKSDPKAEWVFYAGRIENNPARQTSVATGLKEGARYVDGELDLTLTAPEVTIDRNDDLTMPYAEIEIPRECYQIQLGGEGEPPVRIRQNQGFFAPTFTLKGPGISIRGEQFRSDFQLEDASWTNGEDIVEMDNVKECNP
ncbi:hypothetical protein [Oceanithermus sp.]|uniref:hypothetical protein n=1 Tax=Oceanithermus sp. TaxID=2268145 RepID=UPI0025D0CB59|nr:hypothetical protein [Oceanithermus sp.]